MCHKPLTSCFSTSEYLRCAIAIKSDKFAVRQEDVFCRSKEQCGGTDRNYI